MAACEGKGADYLGVEWMVVDGCAEDPASPMIGRNAVILRLDTGEPGPARRFVLSVDEARTMVRELADVLDEIDEAADDDGPEG